jgi:hypothetical protein
VLEIQDGRMFLVGIVWFGSIRGEARRRFIEFTATSCIA